MYLPRAFQLRHLTLALTEALKHIRIHLRLHAATYDIEYIREVDVATGPVSSNTANGTKLVFVERSTVLSF